MKLACGFAETRDCEKKSAKEPYYRFEAFSSVPNMDAAHESAYNFQTTM